MFEERDLWQGFYLQLSGHCKLGCCKVERMVKSDKDDKGKDHSVVSDDAADLRRHSDNVFVGNRLALVGKKGVYLKLLMKVHVKKVPKKRMTERKNMSGTYSQEWERTPMNLRRSVSIQ